VCAPEQLLSHDDCVVFSVGSNGEASFESAILAEFPHCKMHTFDPTLTPKRVRKVRQLLTHRNRSFSCTCRCVAMLSKERSTFQQQACNVTWKFDLLWHQVAALLHSLSDTCRCGECAV
jgi:Methyltransferase domain